MSTSMSFRLFSRAPLMTTDPRLAGRRDAGVAIDF
jgi:hypothetical protein